MDDVLKNTVESQCFVDFENKRYCCGYIGGDMEARKWLCENKFVSVDEPILFPLLALNSNGCKTLYSCGGHFDGVHSSYFVFDTITEEMEAAFKDTVFWKQEIRSDGKHVWRSTGKTYRTWLYALNELFSITSHLQHDFTMLSIMDVTYTDWSTGKVIDTRDNLKDWLVENGGIVKSAYL